MGLTIAGNGYLISKLKRSRLSTRSERRGLGSTIGETEETMRKHLMLPGAVGIALALAMP
jgi:hypothetical protein